MKSVKSLNCLPTTPTPPTLSIASSVMVPARVASTQASGSDRQQLPGASSKSTEQTQALPHFTNRRSTRALANSHESSLRVYSTGDGPDVYEDEFMKIAKPEGEAFHPTLILVGTRLGIDKITPVYWEALIASLQMPQSVGIAG